MQAPTVNAAPDVMMRCRACGLTIRIPAGVPVRVYCDVCWPGVVARARFGAYLDDYTLSDESDNGT